MKKHLSRVLTFLLIACCLVGLMAPAAMAAPVAEATIDETKTGSITLYKYDFTNAVKDGVWEDDPDYYWSDGLLNEDGVNNVLGGTSREDGDDTTNDVSNTLGNGQTSNGYAIAGVEFSYLKVADIVTYSGVQNNASTVMTVFGFASDDELLNILGLTDADRYAPADTAGMWYFTSLTLNTALRNALADNPTEVKNALEAYMINGNGTAMPLTNADGMSKVEGLPLGLYLLVETKVPEMVTETTNPFFLSLPMTSVMGDMEDNGGWYWNYNPVVYPKNETGIVTLEKTVREALDDTAKHTGSLTDITDGYAHNATASAGDVVEYQIISTLPTITSSATNLSAYTFVDKLSKGQTYNKYDPNTGVGGVKIEWFSDKACTNLVATWAEQDGKFELSYADGENGSESMTITMTASGLAEINTAAGSFANVNNYTDEEDTTHVFAGYSNYTVRVTYAATLNSDASVTCGDAGNDNVVSLLWSRTSSNYYDVITDDCHVYTYAIELTKEFEGLTADEALDNDLFYDVSFKLWNATDGYYVKAVLNRDEGIYYVTDHVENEAEATAFVPQQAAYNGSLEHIGKFVIKGLEDDTYVLTETSTANGYILLADDITITISTKETEDSCSVYANEEKKGLTQNDSHYTTYTGTDLELANIPQAMLEHKLLTASATVDGDPVSMHNDKDIDGVSTDSANAIAPLTVINTPGYDIPTTGDDSLILLVSMGTLIVVCAVALLVIVCKRKKEQV